MIVPVLCGPRLCYSHSKVLMAVVCMQMLNILHAHALTPARPTMQCIPLVIMPELSHAQTALGVHSCDAPLGLASHRLCLAHGVQPEGLVARMTSQVHSLTCLLLLLRARMCEAGLSNQFCLSVVCLSVSQGKNSRNNSYDVCEVHRS